MKSAMSAIIRQDSQSLGVICAYSMVSRAFNHDDINFLQSIANVLGQAIAKARAEREVERSERHFRSLIEGALDLVTLVDENAVFLFQSPAVERILGYTQQDMLGRSAFDFIHPDDAACVAQRFRGAIEQPGAAVEFELRFRHKSGAWLTLETSGRRLRDDLGPPRMVFNSRDVTERKRAQLELAKARDEALESSRLKSAFLASMSHEIRTPINVILGYKDLIADHLEALDDASQQGHLDAINRGGQRLLHTIQQILDFSRIEARAFEVNPGPVDVARMLQRQVADLQILAAQKRLRLTCDIREPSSVVQFDEYCLSNAVTNLLQNAIKFTEHGEVTARLSRDDGGCLQLDVTDTGVGIAPEFLDRIFEAFSQEESGYGRRFEGAGLGLALVRKYIELNGARLVVASTKGVGSTFTISFPSPQARAAQE